MTRSLKILPIILILFIVSIFNSCQTSQIAKDPYIAFDQKQFSVAIPLLKKEYKRAKSTKAKGKIAFYIAESYKNLHESINAGEWYKTHYDLTDNINSLELHAKALKTEKKYTQASRVYKSLSKLSTRTRFFRKQSELCLEIVKWLENSLISAEVTSMSFNTKYSENGAFLYDHNKLIFSSDKPTSKDKTYYWSGDGFSQFYQYSIKDEKLSTFDLFKNEGQQGFITMNKKEDYVIYTLCENNKEEVNYCQLVSSKLVDGNWSSPSRLAFILENQNYAHPTLSTNGKTLYFSSKNLDGWGQYDIYESKFKNNEWQAPRLLSRKINTDKNEMYPTIVNDTLYFSSDGLNGMGGLDIFYSVKKNGKWTDAINLRYPINSPMDDFNLIITQTNKDQKNQKTKGYLSSNRKGTQGKDDIFSFSITEDISKPKIIIEEKVIEPIYLLTLNFEDQEKNTIQSAEVEIEISPTILLKDTSITNTFINVDKDTYYNIEISSQGYLNTSKKYSIPREYWDLKDSVINLETTIILQKLELNKEIVLDNVYYDFNKSNLRPDAYPALNNLVDILNNNPSIKIQLASHTDCRGKIKYNQELSQKRAESVVDYLISKNIDKSRLVAKGYGENLPAISCNCADCTEEEHQTNRRTAFSILEK